MRPLLFFTIVFASVLLGAGCFFRSNPSSPSEETPLPSIDIVTIEVTSGDGQVFPLTVEVPRVREASIRGLMGRESMPEDEGMLFLLGSLRSGFWMKDTLIPLSAAFISSEGVIQHIEDMEPQTLDIHNTDKPYIYGLEVNKGWFERHGVEVGDSVRFPWPYDSPPKSPWEPQ